MHVNRISKKFKLGHGLCMIDVCFWVAHITLAVDGERSII